MQLINDSDAFNQSMRPSGRSVGTGPGSCLGPNGEDKRHVSELRLRPPLRRFGHTVDAYLEASSCIQRWPVI